MPMTDTRRAAIAVVGLGWFALASPVACGGGDAAPTSPAGPTATTPRASPAAVTAYVDSALLFTQEYFYFASRIDWTALRQRTLSRASGAQTFQQTYAALDTMARELDDPHSGFLPPSQSLGRREDPSGPLYTPVSAVVAPKIGYLWLTSFGGINGTARADTLIRLIADVDSAAGGVCGSVRCSPTASPAGSWSAIRVTSLIIGWRLASRVSRTL
jgi:hypothetical protein